MPNDNHELVLTTLRRWLQTRMRGFTNQPPEEAFKDCEPLAGGLTVERFNALKDGSALAFPQGMVGDNGLSQASVRKALNHISLPQLNELIKNAEKNHKLYAAKQEKGTPSKNILHPEDKEISVSVEKLMRLKSLIEDGLEQSPMTMPLNKAKLIADEITIAPLTQEASDTPDMNVKNYKLSGIAVQINAAHRSLPDSAAVTEAAQICDEICGPGTQTKRGR